MCANLLSWPRSGLCTFGQNQNEEEFGAHLSDIVVASTRITLPGSGSGQLGSPQRSAPTHLRTLALLGANVGFLSNFSGGSTEPRRFPGAGTGCQLASVGGRRASFRLWFVCPRRGRWGPEGAYAQPHEFPSKIRSQVRVTSVEGYGQQGGRDRWPTFGVLLPTGSSRGECANTPP